MFRFKDRMRVADYEVIRDMASQEPSNGPTYRKNRSPVGSLDDKNEPTEW